MCHDDIYCSIFAMNTKGDGAALSYISYTTIRFCIYYCPRCPLKWWMAVLRSRFLQVIATAAL